MQPAESVLLQTLEHAATGLAILDAEGRVREANPSFVALFHQPLSRLSSVPMVDLLHPSHRQGWLQAIQALLAGSTTSTVLDTCFLVGDDSVFVSASISLLQGLPQTPSISQPDHTPGPSPRIVLLLQDETQLKHAQRALIKTEGLTSLGRLTASIAHELNNPLESVNNLLYLISQSDQVDEIRRYSRLAEEEMERVTRISTQTLRFYRPQAAPHDTQMTDVLESVLSLFEGRLRRQQVKVIRSYRADVPSLVTYSSELRQVFVNLVSNGLDAMEDSGTLRVSVRPAHSWSLPGNHGLRATVSDTGSGIPHSLLKKVFEPFITTKQATGTGLGLWISRDIIRRHGGTLRVRSSVTGASRGTTMSVFLPASNEKPSVSTMNPA